MTLLTYLTNLGVVVPEKKKELYYNDETKNGSQEGFNACHDQWANIEVPEDRNLEENKVRMIVRKYHSQWYTHVQEQNAIGAMHVLFCVSKWHGEMIDELCSLQPTVKVPSELELMQLIQEGLNNYDNNEKLGRKGAVHHIAKAIRTYLIGSEK